MTRDRKTTSGRLRPAVRHYGWAVLAVLLLIIIGWLELSEPVNDPSDGIVRAGTVKARF